MMQAEATDHRRLGRALRLFATHELVGAGMPLWLPRGAAIKRALEDYIIEEERRAGYVHVSTPPLAKRRLYEASGHWDHYVEEMFPAMADGGDELVLRPMNCPHHCLVFDVMAPSYRDLPLRIGELAPMFRNERSGVLGGLTRVRAMELNDAHIFCTRRQLADEFAAVVAMIEGAYGDLGITDYWYRLSFRDANRSGKYIDDDAVWERAEGILIEALDHHGADYVAAPGEAAFYGPKLDVQVHDFLGRELTLSTVQIDFVLPERLGIGYVSSGGAEERPVIIHRSVVSTMERMIGHLIEVNGGAFPPWLAPEIVAVLPVNEDVRPAAQVLHRELIDAGLRASLDDSERSLGARVRAAVLDRVPYVAIIGRREVDDGRAAIRARDDDGSVSMDRHRFIEFLRTAVRSRAPAARLPSSLAHRR